MYLMSYFRTAAEALHYAVSGDGLAWKALNGARPVYWSKIGSKSIRDPFLIRSRSGTFHLISSNSWKTTTIFHAVSDDLITWRDADLPPVMSDVAGTNNCWAPEAIFDPQIELYRVFWSSTTPYSMPYDRNGHNNRIWGATTSDFKTYSTPAVFFDPGYNVIDATIAARPEGGYLMAFKDERGENEKATPYKAIRMAAADSLAGPWEVRQPYVTTPLTEGPALFRSAGRWLLICDHFAFGHFGEQESDDGFVWRDVAARASFPDGIRHASVIEIEDDLADALAEKLG